MNKLHSNSATPTPVKPLTTSEQNHIKGGMASTDEEKAKKVKKGKAIC